MHFPILSAHPEESLTAFLLHSESQRRELCVEDSWRIFVMLIRLSGPILETFYLNAMVYLQLFTLFSFCVLVSVSV